MDEKKEQNRTINIFKGMACILVMFSHYHHSGSLGNIEYTVSHLGVPFFFLVSGYYLFGSDTQRNGKRMLRKMKWILCLLCIHFSIYFLHNSIQRYLINGTEFTSLSLFEDLHRIFTWNTVKSALLWSTGFLGVGQWFLVALFQAYLFVFVVVLFHKEDILQKNSLAIATVLFFMHIFVRYGLYRAGIIKVGLMSITETAFVRNAWFDALPFLMVGLYLKNHHVGSEYSIYYVFGGGNRNSCFYS